MKEGDWVEASDGRVGMYHECEPPQKRKALIQFGADGPLEKHWKGHLLPATKEQIAEKEGCRP